MKERGVLPLILELSGKNRLINLDGLVCLASRRLVIANVVR